MNILIDIDGVLRVGKNLLPGAKELLASLEQSNHNVCLLSNSTKLSSEEVKDYFLKRGVDLKKVKIQTALSVAIQHCEKHYKRIQVYCVPSAKTQFPKHLFSSNPEIIVVGDLIDGWNYDVLNEMFNHVKKGAKLLAMQQNKFGKNAAGELYLDAGSFIKAIEFATGVEADLIGKPSKVFFENAILLAGGNVAEDFTMMGDDLTADIEGAQQLGAKTILPLTGKTSSQDLKKSDIIPDLILEDLTGFSFET